MTNITTLASHYGLDRLLPTALGFENAFAALDNASHLLTATQTAFPPVNVIKKDDYNFILELAVAGYRQNEIEGSIKIFLFRMGILCVTNVWCE